MVCALNRIGQSRPGVPKRHVITELLRHKLAHHTEIEAQTHPILLLAKLLDDIQQTSSSLRLIEVRQARVGDVRRSAN